MTDSIFPLRLRSGKTLSTGRTKITAALAKDLPALGRRYAVRDATVSGLILRIGKEGKASWYLDYRAQGRRTLYRLGSLAELAPATAKDKARKALGRVAAGNDPAESRREERRAKGRTVRAYLTGEYRKTVLVHRKSGEATEKRIAAAWAEVLDVDMTALTPRLLERIRTRRVEEGLTPQTANRDRVALLAMINHAAEHGVIPRHQLARFRPLKTDDDQRVRYLGQQGEGERARFEAALERQPEPFRSMVRVALGSGMRRGELFGLTWKAIDFRANALTVTAHTAKSARARRIPMSSAVRETLLERRRQQPDIPRPTYVFLNPDTGLPFTSVKHQWAKLCAEAAVEDFRLHDTRHDFASRLVMNGTPLAVVRDLLGHASISMTERYAHVGTNALRQAVEGLS